MSLYNLRTRLRAAFAAFTDPTPPPVSPREVIRLVNRPVRPLAAVTLLFYPTEIDITESPEGQGMRLDDRTILAPLMPASWDEARLLAEIEQTVATRRAGKGRFVAPGEAA